MFNVDGNIISLTKGNTAVLDILPWIDTPDNPVFLEENDKVLFTIKHLFGNVMLQRVLTKSDQNEDGCVKLTIYPEETINMAPAEYTYDVVLIFESGESYTFIPKSTFQILPAVGTYQDLEVEDA